MFKSLRRRLAPSATAVRTTSRSAWSAAEAVLQRVAVLRHGGEDEVAVALEDISREACVSGHLNSCFN